MNLAPISTSNGGVYSPRTGRVKNEAASCRRTGLVILCASLAAALTGCVLPVRRTQTGTPAEPARRTDFLIGIRYQVEPLRRSAGDLPDPRIHSDFQHLSELGFDTVLVAHVAQEDRRCVLQAARRSHLRLILPDRPILHYVRTGCLGRDHVSLHAMLNKRIAPDHFKPPVAMLHIGRVSDEASCERAARVAERLRRIRPTLAVAVTLAPSYVPPPGELDRLVLLRQAATDETPPTADSSPAARRAATGPAPIALLPISKDAGQTGGTGRQWLRLFHAALAAGNTGGVILDAYSETPGRREGLLDNHGRLPVRRTQTGLPVPRSAAVKKLIARARGWGPLLRGMPAREVQDVQTIDDDVRTVLFRQGRRRFVLVWNRSPDRFVRCRVVLSDLLAGLPVRRAVQVPGDSGVIAGEVIRAQGGQVAFHADLAPGDAALYEMF